MSRYYKPVTFTAKHRKLDWINAITALHDIYCACNDPLKHTITGIIEQEPSLQFDKEDSTKIQKCLTTGDGDHGEDVVEGFGDGELEKLFEGDFGEEDHTG